VLAASAVALGPVTSTWASCRVPVGDKHREAGTVGDQADDSQPPHEAPAPPRQASEKSESDEPAERTAPVGLEAWIRERSDQSQIDLRRVAAEGLTRFLFRIVPIDHAPVPGGAGDPFVSVLLPEVLGGILHQPHGPPV